MADLNFIESGYFVPDHGYYVYTADGGTSLTVSSNLSAVQRIDNKGYANLTVTSDLNADGSATLLGSTGRSPNTQIGIKANIAGIEFYG